MGTGMSLLFPSLALLVVDRVDPARRGAAMGAFTAFFDLGVGLGAPFAGLVASWTGEYPPAFYVGGSLCLRRRAARLVLDARDPAGTAAGMSRVLAVCHPAGGTSGVFHDAARATRARTIDEWLPAGGREPPAAARRLRRALVLGGDQNVYERTASPTSSTELALLREWLPGGRPMLGVCLGAQLLAEAAGGRVVRASSRELGLARRRASCPPRPATRCSASAPARLHGAAVAQLRGRAAAGRRSCSRAAPSARRRSASARRGACSSTPRSTARSCDGWLADLDRGVPPQARDAELLEAGVAEHLRDVERRRPRAVRGGSSPRRDDDDATVVA